MLECFYVHYNYSQIDNQLFYTQEQFSSFLITEYITIFIYFAMIAPTLYML